MPATTEDVTSGDALALLMDVVERNFPAAVEFKRDGAWRRRKSRFLGVAGGPQGDGPAAGALRPGGGRLWLEAPVEAGGDGPAELAPGDSLIASFTHLNNRYRFVSSVIGGGSFRLAGGAEVDGVMIAWPAAVHRLQRRNYYRQPIPCNQRVQVVVWVGGLAGLEQVEAGQRPAYTGQLVNISVGGLCMQLYGKADPQLGPNDPVGLRFQLAADGPELELDALVRRCARQANGAVGLGVQFVGLEASIEGRRTLAHLSETISVMQRRGIRVRHVGAG